MTIKIERDTVHETLRKNTDNVFDAAHAAREAAHNAREVTREVVKGPRDGPLPGTTGKHPISESLGTAITGGKAMAGTKGYMMVRILSFSCLCVYMAGWLTVLVASTLYRPTSTSSKRTRFAPKCSQLVLWPVCKS